MKVMAVGISDLVSALIQDRNDVQIIKIRPAVFGLGKFIVGCALLFSESESESE